MESVFKSAWILCKEIMYVERSGIIWRESGISGYQDDSDALVPIYFRYLLFGLHLASLLWLFYRGSGGQTKTSNYFFKLYHFLNDSTITKMATFLTLKRHYNGIVPPNHWKKAATHFIYTMPVSLTFLHIFIDSKVSM